MRLLAFSLVILLIALPACRNESADASGSGPDDAVSIPFRSDGRLSFLRSGDTLTSINIEIAETDSARRRGLMQRSSLPDSSGMLFLFDRPEQSGFWMANTPLSLDIIFVNPDSQIVDIAKYTKPLSPKNVSSRQPYRYVVEVPAGFADTHGLVAGNRLRWQRKPTND